VSSLPLELLECIQEIGKSNMESRAVAKYIHQSPYKIRRTLNAIRGMSLDEALNYLQFCPEKASNVIEKTIRSAVSNILNQNQENELDQKSLKLKEMYVDGGPVMKRFRAASMGRASRLRRPTSHLTVVVKSKKKRI
tara:strand:+ start:1772 stop:2182 length:411 start_codon:yes stop_codon:yes gene_type:complete